MRILPRILLLTLCSLGVAMAQKSNIAVMPGEESGGYGIRKLRHVEIFQGGRRHRNYYEGWYYKCATSDGAGSFAFIPGLSFGAKGDTAEAFVQFIDGQTAETHWFSFPLRDFSYSRKRLAVRIGPNYFSHDSLYVRLGNGRDSIRSELRLGDPHPWPRKPFHRGIMGWYGYIPGMETCHGLLSLDHRVDGWLEHGGKYLAVTGGRGYLEKDWGSSFPQRYIWMQSNVFGADSASFMCSIATIPFLGGAFQGFLGYAWVKGQLYPFATYTHAKLEVQAVAKDGVRITVRERGWTLEVHATRQASGELRAPQAGTMSRRISESIEARVHLRLLGRDGKLVWEGNGVAAGLEIVGQWEPEPRRPASTRQ